jgi:hypothetical protein
MKDRRHEITWPTNEVRTLFCHVVDARRTRRLAPLSILCNTRILPQPFFDFFLFCIAYLAWTRTGLALIGASLGLLKWDSASTIEGYLVAVMGIVVLISATRRYYRNMQLLEVGKFEPNVHGVLSVVVVVVVAIAVAFVLQFRHEHTET